MTRPRFDVQAHRGGAGLWPENTLAAFANAIELGVTTLELDAHVTLDGVAVVHHDRILPDGEYISWLTAEQTHLPRLAEVIDLARPHPVELNVETKFDAVAEGETAPRERFAEVMVAELSQRKMLDRTSIQSFDWAVLDLIGATTPLLRRNVLTSLRYQRAHQPGPSPWQAGIDIDDFDGDVVAAASGRGYDTISPEHRLVDEEFVTDAHAAGLRVLPYTVDDPKRIEELIRLGVDGVITDRPDLAIAVADTLARW